VILRLLLAAFLVLAGAGTANARGEGTCSPASLGIFFGSFTGSEITSIGSIVLTCRGDGRLDYRVALSTGAGTYDLRQMKQGANSLGYNLYSDSRHRQVWGDGTGNSSDVRGAVSLRRDNLQTVIVTVYAQLPAAPPPAVGTYSDTIVVTVTTDDGVSSSAFPVTAIATANCAISATNLPFPDYAGSQVDGQSLISLNCNAGLHWNVGLSPGNFAGATVASRRMSGPGFSSLGYALYRDPTRSLNWGNVIGVDTVSGTGTGTPQNIPVFGRIPAAQSARAGGYRDTIVATVSF
jgi:spore coat protein U-like protein